MRVLASCLHFQRHAERYRPLFEERGVTMDLPCVDQQLLESELLEIIDHYHGILAGDDEITRRVLEHGRRLRVVAKWGIGLDAIDCDAARELGIAVYNTPDVFADEVADVAIGYLLLLARQLHRMDRSVRSGGWLKVEGISLRDKILGVVGIGSIGREVVRRARALGMKAVGSDVVEVAESFRAETGLEETDLEDLLRRSDFVSLNCPLTAESHHLLGEDAFSQIKPGAFVINTGRGALINESALVAALRSGRVAGAALDVYEDEPLPADSPLRAFDRCIFGTHNASNTREAVERVNERALANLFHGLGLERPAFEE